MKKEGKFIVFSAPSGSGKTTIVRHLLEQQELNLDFSISATSRAVAVRKLMEKIIILFHLKYFNNTLKTMILLSGKKCIAIIFMEL